MSSAANFQEGSPVATVLVFVLTLFLAIGGYIYHVNAELDKLPKKPKKKVSKKKERRNRPMGPLE